ncbi:MAG: hypothetical protein JW809_01740, partial [Pirellulales bacterium]|nr:hypothetical protein [Pirellulales bacterium]
MTGCQTTIRQTRLASSLACVLAVAITPPASAAAPRAGGSVVVHGSWAGLKIAGRLAMEFNRRNPKAAVDFLPRDSNQMGGILRERECDVGLVLDSLAPNVGETLGQRFDAFPLGRFSVGVIVNARNRARSIEADALGSAFQGNVTSWADVGKGNGPRQIELFMPLAPTSESWIFQHGVMQGGFSAAVCNESTRFHRQKLSDAAIVGAVIEKQNAIAFFLLGPNTIIDDRIRLLAIAKRPAPAVLPTLETIAEGTYPIIDQLTFFLHPDAP